MNILTLNNLTNDEVRAIINLAKQNGIVLNGYLDKVDVAIGEVEEVIYLINGELFGMEEMEDVNDHYALHGIPVRF